MAASLLALILGVSAAWSAIGWLPALLPAALLLAVSAALLLLAFQPAVELRRGSIRFGSFYASWLDVRRVEYRRRLFVLFIHICLSNGSERRILHPGSRQSCEQLLRDVRRFSTSSATRRPPLRQELRDVSQEDLKPLQSAVSPAGRVLSADDEAEVELLFRRLKTVGHLDSAGQSEEN